MRKANKIMMITVSVLLSAVLLTTSALSGTLAKYTTSATAHSESARVAKWGISVTTGDHLEKQYTEMGEEAFMVHTKGATDVIAPGTSGSLAWFRVYGAPEVAYGIDFSGSIDIGDGFKASSGLIRGENGDAIEYFPIQLRYVVYDVLSNGDLTEVTSLTSDQFCVQRTDKQDNQHYFNDGALENIAELTTVMNSSTDMGINNALDELYQAPNTSIDRIYAIEWKWLYHYDTTEEVAAGKTENNRETTAKGNYQTRELDTTLGEAITKNPELFNITLNMSVTVEQLNGAATYKLFYENDVRKIEFGSYPQTDVTATKGEALNELVGTNYSSWDDYKYTSGDMRYIDVTLDGEKYRGVYFTTERNSKQTTNGYQTNQAYWFKYEPIKWTIIDRDMSEGKILIFCDLAIDSQQFYINTDNRTINSKTVYPNNYEHSTVRAWLNETFYNTAFSDLQKQIISEIEVVNDATSTSASNNTYICSNTIDNVFLLSYAEAKLYDEAGLYEDVKYFTEYALSQGVGVTDRQCIEWWLRSPYPTGANDARAVDDEGNYTYINPVTSTDMGIIPALWIKL